MSETQNPYAKPITPKNSLELLRWVVMEPTRVKRYESTLEKKEDQIKVFLKAYGAFCVLFILFWLISALCIAYWNVPEAFSNAEAIFDEPFLTGWRGQGSTEERFVFFILFSYWRLAFGLAVGLAVGLALGLALGLAEGLAFGLAVGLAFGLAVGLALGLAEGLAFGLAVGLAFGLAFGLAEGLAFGLAVGLAEGLAFGLTLGLAFGLAFGLAGGLAGGLAFYLFYFRLPFWVIYHFLGFLAVRLDRNLYLRDEVVWLPVWGVDQKLQALAKQKPEEAIRFINFLLEHRSLQGKLAMKLWHTVAGTKLQDASWEYELSSPPQLESQPKLTPSAQWLNAYERLDQALKRFRQETNARTRLVAYREVSEALQALKQINLQSSSRWNHYYFQPLNELESKVNDKLSQLQQEAAPIVSNPYQVGGSLDPKYHKVTFLGREDLKDKLTFIVRTSEEMPLFLVQGQRRVGKTSLLKFLPDLLGPGFKVVMIDLQEGAYSCIEEWLSLIRIRVNEAFGIQEEEPWQATEDWLLSWTALSQHLSELAEQHKIRLVLAFDEYEALQDRGFAHNIQKAEQLLGAMRSYTQHQKKVILLFTGAHYFDELEDPNWGAYFVHSQPLEVRFLSREKTLQLTSPTEDFPIVYEDRIPEQIYELTRGHPALAQEICYYLVETANEQNRNTLTEADLERILENRILVEHNHPMSRFWKDFCREEKMKETVRQVIRQERPSNKACLKKLLRHQFVLKTAERYQLCNPLFEQYIKRFDLEFFEV